MRANLTPKQRSHLYALDSAHRDGCEDRSEQKPVSVWPWDDEPELTAAYMDGYNGREMTHRCFRCGQSDLTSTAPHVCSLCREIERDVQGTPERLFELAPTQLEGQLTF